MRAAGERAAASRTFIGQLSGEKITIGEDTRAPMPALSPDGVIYNGSSALEFGGVGAVRGYPDATSFRRKFGLIVPATNTSMEHDLWRIIFANQSAGGLRGVGLQTARVMTPKPHLDSQADLADYKRQFLEGLRSAVDRALLAQPHYMIMGMSLEHILAGLDEIKAPVAQMQSYSGLSWAAWHDAIAAALKKYQAKRIGLLTPFDKAGNRSAIAMFEALGFEVVSSVGFSCVHARHIAHIPDWAKEKAVLELLATDANRLDAVVQCGTNMSLVDVAERLEPILDIPILAINPVTFWYALRENGFGASLAGAGRLLREF